MKDIGVNKKIFYFHEQGRNNIEHVLVLSKERAKELDIKKIIVFTANGDGPLIAIESGILKDTPEIKLIAVTFPYNQKFYIGDIDGQETELSAGIIDESIRTKLKEAQVEIVQGVMPFQDIMLPDVKDTKLLTITSTLELFGAGITLCIEAAIMSCDSGVVSQGEEVIAMAGDTAIVVRASKKSLIFSPFDGMEIKEIICKPRNLTINREGHYKRSLDS